MKVLIKIYILISCMLCVSSVHADSKIRALPFIQTPIDNESVILLCEKLKIECATTDIKLYRVKGAIDAYYYLIDPSPKLFKLYKDQGQFTLIDQWDFKDYPHSHQSNGEEDGLQRTGLKIYPAFYPS